MTLLKSACAVFAAASFACGAQAATYAVSGVMTGVDSWFTPDASGLTMDTYDNSFDPANPAFSGLWNIDLSTLSLSGVADFESYQASTYWTGTFSDGAGNSFPFSGYRILTRPHDVQTIDGTNATYGYDAATRTLTVQQPLITLTGTSENCVPVGPDCDFVNVPANSVDEITFQLVFGEDLLSFTGTSTINRSFVDSNYNDSTSWSFSGTAVPVPASAWMLGSGLIGLAGVARRRKA